MHADEDAHWLNEIPFDVPNTTAMLSADDMDIHATDTVVRAAFIISSSGSADDFCNLICCDLTSSEQVFDIDMASALVKNLT